MALERTPQQLRHMGCAHLRTQHAGCRGGHWPAQQPRRPHSVGDSTPGGSRRQSGVRRQRVGAHAAAARKLYPNTARPQLSSRLADEPRDKREIADNAQELPPTPRPCAARGIMPGLMAAAPRDPPAALLGAYTLQQQVPLERFYVDDASSMAGSTTRFSSDEIAGCVRTAERDLRLVALVEEAESAVGAAAVGAGARRRAAQQRGGVARHLVTNALAASGAASAEGLDVLVFGATDPWLEPKPNLTWGWTLSLSLSLTSRCDGPVARVPVPGSGGQVGDDGRVPGARVRAP